MLRKSDLYQNYEALIVCLQHIDDDNLKDFQKIFPGKSDNEIKKTLYNKAEKLKYKMDSIIPKMTCDEISVIDDKSYFEGKLNVAHITPIHI